MSKDWILPPGAPFLADILYSFSMTETMLMTTVVMMMMAMIRRCDGCEAAWGRMARGEDERWERLASLDTSGDPHHHHRDHHHHHPQQYQYHGNDQ